MKQKDQDTRQNQVNRVAVLRLPVLLYMGEERRVKCGLDMEMHLKEGMTQQRKVDNRTNKVFIQQIELCVVLKLCGFKIPLQS